MRRCIIHPNEVITLRERKSRKSSRTQYHDVRETTIRRNQEVNKDKNGQLQVKPYPKRK